jgi:hypothetical protein
MTEFNIIGFLIGVLIGMVFYLIAIAPYIQKLLDKWFGN